MQKKLVIVFGVLAVLSSGTYYLLSYSKVPESLVLNKFPEVASGDLGSSTEDLITAIPENIHIDKPQHVKAIYMSSWVAGTNSFRNNLTKFVEDSELNSIIIDFKDSTGVVSTPAGEGSSVNRLLAGSRRGGDLESYIKELHSKDIYTIARIAVFEDPVYSKNNLSTAVQNSSGNLWKDKHGLSWVDPGDKEFHQYILDLALEAHNIGFDEINFDYIRFPTDGSKDKVFPISDYSNKQPVITGFISWMHSELSSRNIPMSIDVFGQTVSTADDMGIGQYYEDLIVNTDVISPMVYPSHFYPGYKNLKSPESMPYETIKYSMQDAVRRRDAISSNTEIRAWVQDFSLAVPYGITEVKNQIKALKELGLESYFVWDPKNIYTKEAYINN